MSVHNYPVTQEEAQIIFLDTFYNYPDKVDEILIRLKHLLDIPVVK